MNCGWSRMVLVVVTVVPLAAPTAAVAQEDVTPPVLKELTVMPPVFDFNRRQRETGNPYVATSIFALGYLAAWAGFSLVAVILQWGFERTDLLSPTLVGTNVVLGGVLLLAAGSYQLTPIKHACLRHCRSPLAFLSLRWRRGAPGALRMGLEHGAYCLGCCWFLMGLLFFGGVMNLYWIVGLALFVLLEKIVPAGHWLGYATGGVLSVWGVAILTGVL